MHLLQRFDASHDLEGVMASVVSTDITLEGTVLNEDTRSMMAQSKIGIARPTVHRGFVLEHEDMFTGKRSKLSRSQCLRLGHKEILGVQLLPDGRVSQIRWMGGLEGQRVMSPSGPSICRFRTSTSGIAVVEKTSWCIDSPPRCVGDQNPASNDDCADIVDSRTEGVLTQIQAPLGRRTMYFVQILDGNRSMH